MFTVHPLSTPLVRWRMQKCGLSAWDILFRLHLTIQHRQRRRLLCAEGQSFMQEWHNVVFSDGSWFCVHYSDGLTHVWRFRGKRFISDCIQYGPTSRAPGVMVWAAIGYTTSKCLAQIDSNLNADRYIYDILHRMVEISLETCKTPSSNKATQGHMLHVVFWPSSMHTVLD